MLAVLVCLVGLYLLIKLRFFFILHPIKTAGELISALKSRSARRSLCLALAGTLGVGNIFGVAAGIMIGGAGSLFWLFLSSFFAMIIKYAETLLVFDEKIDRGGMSRVFLSVFSKCGRLLSFVYALLMLLLAFFMGSAMQSAALIDTAEKSLSVFPVITAIIFTILILPCIVGGARKIENITEIVIPLTTIIYILMCLWVIASNISALPTLIKHIISSAFDYKSAIGGGIGFISVREGFSRGILSNEAGVGTSAMAHSRSRDRTPHIAGLFAMTEVVFDTTLLCMLTGFAILLTIPAPTLYTTPMALIGGALRSCFGSLSDFLLPILIFSFAYATIACWYYYGRECVLIYFPRIARIYPIIFLLFAYFSRLLRSEMLLSIIDILLLLMSIMTLSAIIKSTPRIVKLSRDALMDKC